MADRHDAGAWLGTLLNQLAALAVRDIAHIPRWEEQSIHQLRKRMKKLQAVLHLARPVLGPLTVDDLKRDVRDLKNVMAKHRDAAVLQKLGRKLGARSRVKAVPSPSEAQLKRAATLARRLVADVAGLDLSDLTWQDISERYAKTYKRSRTAWDAVQKDETPETLHEWRKMVKRLSYQSLALEPWLEEPEKLRRTQKLGSLLGSCHDLDVFASTAEAGKLQPPQGWQDKIAERRTELLSRIGRSAPKVFKRTPKKARRTCERALP